MNNYNYDFDRPFQLKLLAALVRKPRMFLPIIEAQYFTIPALVDIARVAKGAYEKYGTAKFRLQPDSLRVLVKKDLSNRNQEGHRWPHYEGIIGKVFLKKLPDLALLREAATDYAKDRRYREALVKAERNLNAGRFDLVHQQLDALRDTFMNGKGDPHALKWEDFTVKPGDEQPAGWLVQGFILANAINVFSGRRGDYKTYLALSLGKAVARGEDFLDLPTQERRVLYLNRDNPKSVFMKRLIRQFKLGPETEKFGHWSLWHPKGEPPKLDVGDVRLRTIARKYEPLMIFDSLRRFHSGDENSATDMNAVFEECRKLTTLGATVIILVNLGKDEKKGPRGSSDIGDAVDMLHEVKARKDKYHPNRKLVYLTTQKDREEGKEGKQVILWPQRIVCGKWEMFRFRRVERAQIDPKERLRKENENLRKKLEDIRQDNPNISERDLAEKLEVSRHQARKLLGKDQSRNESK